MGMDPHTIKELLQLQIWNRSSLLTSGGASKTDAESDFSGLLNSLIARQQEAQADPVDGRGEQRPGRETLAAAMFANRMSLASWSKYLQADDIAANKATDFENAIQAASRKFGVEPTLVKAVIHTESSFNPKAVSRAGAKGLMQLMDGTGQAMGVDDPFDPQQNIEGGTKYLSGLLMKYNGNPGAALAAYNAGPGRVDKLGIRNDRDLEAKLHLLPEETQQYVRKVMQLKYHYEA